MSLSDYAFIAFDNEGKSTEEFGKFGRINIEPYKTWLYIHSSELWAEGESFVENTIAQIEEGSVNLFGVNISVQFVALVNKDGIPYETVKLFYCQNGYGEHSTSFGGVICYAYLDYALKFAKDAGIPADWDVSEMSQYAPEVEGKIIRFLECYPPGQPDINADQEEWDKYLEKKKTIPISKEQEEKMGLNAYCGITDDMINALLEWNVPDKEWKEKVKNSNDRFGFNKGNLYFADNLGFEPPKDFVGEVGPVIAHELLRK